MTMKMSVRSLSVAAVLLAAVNIQSGSAFTVTKSITTFGSKRSNPFPQLQSSESSLNRPPATSLWAATPNQENNRFLEKIEQPVDSHKKVSTDPTPVLFALIENALSFVTNQMDDDTATSSSSKAPIFAVAALALMLAFSPLSASAAMSGGRMGGSFSAPRQSYRAPAAPRPSINRGYGYNPGYYSRPNVIVPYVAPSPFYSPFGFGGPAVMTYARGPSLFDLLFFGGITFMVLNAVTSAARGGVETAGSFFSDVASGDTYSVLGSGTSVVQVSVALEVPDRDDRNSILSVLARLAQTARTDSRVGIQQLTSQVALELLRRKSSIVSAATKYQHYSSREKAQREYNNLSVQERAKFEQETLSKYGGVDYSMRQDDVRARLPAGETRSATVAVVTLVLAIDGDSTKVPKINSIQDVEAALAKIASDAKVDDCLQAAEILWTPEDRDETLTLREVISDYPELRSV